MAQNVAKLVSNKCDVAGFNAISYFVNIIITQNVLRRRLYENRISHGLDPRDH